jgi:CBS domain-containing protein
MYVHDAMQPLAVTVEPHLSLQKAVMRMASKGATAALVIDPEGEGPAVLSHHDVVEAVGRGLDLAAQRVADHARGQIVLAEPDWSLDKAARTMTRLNALYLLVCDDGELAGIVRMRDIVRCWSTATEESPLAAV